MLPFMKKRQQAGLIVQTRQPDEPKESSDMDMDQEALEAAAQDLIDAVASQSRKQVAEALKAAFTILECMPHDEADDNSFDAQNEKAAE